MAKPNERERPGQNQNRSDYTAYDRALIKAKEAQKLVTFELATGDVLADCTICSVDKFAIEVEHNGPGPMKGDYTNVREWINKSLIARTRIQK